jgi:hypothetical protein
MDVAVHEQPGGARQGCLSQFQIAVDFLDLNFHLNFSYRVTDSSPQAGYRVGPLDRFR